MIYRTAYSDDAKLDTKEIVTYLSQFYASTARNFKTELTKQVNGLKYMPLLCQVYEDDPFFRRMVVGEYLLFYSVDEERKLVTVHRLFHHSQDIKRFLAEYRMRL